MNVVIGFGSTETEVEKAEENAFTDFVEGQYRAQKLDYFTDEFIKQVEDWAKQRAHASRQATKGFAKSEDHPDRYSDFYYRITSSASDVVLVATFHHINRRHGLSPDGWALMQTKRLFHVSSMDILS